MALLRGTIFVSATKAKPQQLISPLAAFCSRDVGLAQSRKKQTGSSFRSIFLNNAYFLHTARTKIAIKTVFPVSYLSQTVQRGYASSENDTIGKGKESGYLVYQGRVGNMFRLLKLFSLTTSAFGLALQPYLAVTYQDMPLAAAIPFFAAINVFVFINPILIHFVAKKYVMELYFDPDARLFTAVMLTFFARKQTFSFTADDIKVPEVPGLFSMLTAKGRPLFVMESDFSSMEVYKHLMGFDKPLDLTFSKTEEERGRE